MELHDAFEVMLAETAVAIRATFGSYPETWALRLYGPAWVAGRNRHGNGEIEENLRLRPQLE